VSYFLFTFKYESRGEHEDFSMALGYTVAESVDEAKEMLKDAAIEEKRNVREFVSVTEYPSLEHPKLSALHRKHFEVAEGAPYQSVIVPFQTAKVRGYGAAYPYGPESIPA
jgi:hypothetical protein